MPVIQRLFLCLTIVLPLSGCGRPAEQSDASPATPVTSLPVSTDAQTTRHQSATTSESELNSSVELSDPAMSAPQGSASEALVQTATIPESAPVVQKVYRPSDTRPQRDDARAAEFGVRKYVSERLILYTDLDPAVAEPLPKLIDQAYAAWIEYFGELPPNREGTPYQITGYLIDQPQRFVDAGMLPEGPPMFRFGRHLRAEFWMNKMNSDYYRRHLLIHEATHCFMTATLQQYPSRWYLEGMAEYFGTHRLHPDGTVEFGVMPDQSEDFPGLGRIELIQQQLAQGKSASLATLGSYTGADWDQPLPVPYAWSWAVCEFLNRHPRYRERFRELGQHMEANDFRRYMEEHFAPESDLLEAEWGEYIRRLDFGMDIPASAFVTASGPLKALEAPVTVSVEAARGWQSTGLKVAAGTAVHLQATGEVVLDQHPRPWVSEPQGISITYAAGQPVGRLLAAVLAPPDTQSSTAFTVVPVGREANFIPERTGELWLRVNDTGSGVKNNTGSYQATIRQEISSPLPSGN